MNGILSFGFPCTDFRETRELLGKAIAQADDDINGVCLPREALAEFVENFVAISDSPKGFWS